MSRRRWGVLLVLGVVVLSGCVGKPVDKVTLEVDLPPEFRFIASAHYLPATGENCSLPQRRGKRPERKIFVTQYKPVAERVSLDLPLAEVIEGCPTVLRSVGFDLRAKWGVRYADVGGDHAVIGIRDRWDVVSTVPEPGVQAVFGTCRWLFRTLGPYHAIRKILQCRSLDAYGEPRLAGGVAQRDQLAGKKLRMVLALSDEEQPYFDDNWVPVPGGWKRCKGKSLEDMDAFCRGNTTDFKPITMPDGRLCDVYPSCQ
ncbi:hypothetical protein DYL61_18705 [Pseudomonas nabeulensis]|uniref:Lipoprotein n=1 Tax=Pseudomonas nabeulensis TaxID=2293833 RepID=A0A4Z0AYJ7_9PSED|nr:hypothetical protein [Pseudomonas nabeulensis]TFY91501.1 hypothetical protein DYL61_18705 [Pseudomonas nabeulensis]